MAAPTRRIPISLDMNQFKQNIADAQSRASEATDFIAKQFLKGACKIGAVRSAQADSKQRYRKACHAEYGAGDCQGLGQFDRARHREGSAASGWHRSQGRIISTRGGPRSAWRGLAPSCRRMASKFATTSCRSCVMRNTGGCCKRSGQHAGLWQPEQSGAARFLVQRG
jgi:hypothetical protein